MRRVEKLRILTVGYFVKNMSKAREWWIDPDYDGYFDDTDGNLIASGFTRAIEYSAYDAAIKERDKARAALAGKTFDDEAAAERARSAKLVEALKDILYKGNMAAHGKWDDTDAMKNAAYQALVEYSKGEGE